MRRAHQQEGGVMRRAHQQGGGGMRRAHQQEEGAHNGGGGIMEDKTIESLGQSEFTEEGIYKGPGLIIELTIGRK